MAEDMDEIRQALADEFRNEPTPELEERGGGQIVDFTAEDVLVLRPAIVDLDLADADRILRSWADTLRQALDEHWSPG